MINHYSHCNVNFEVSSQVAKFLGKMAEEGVLGSVPWPGSDVLFNLRGNAVVGMILYQKGDYKDTQIQVNAGYVLPAYRHQGVYKELWNFLIEMAKLNKCSSIRGDVLASNYDSIEIFKMMGRELVGVTFIYEVKES